MKPIILLVLGILMSPQYSQAQTAAAPASPDSSASKGSMPESMQIQQRVESSITNPSDLTTPGGAPTTDAPNGTPSPVERNRLDITAPSPQRVQVKEGANTKQSPYGAGQAPASSGSIYNTIIDGSPSSSGTSSGTTGSAGVGSPTAPTSHASPSSSMSGSHSSSSSH